MPGVIGAASQGCNDRCRRNIARPRWKAGGAKTRPPDETNRSSDSTPKPAAPGDRGGRCVPVRDHDERKGARWLQQLQSTGSRITGRSSPTDTGTRTASLVATRARQSSGRGNRSPGVPIGAPPNSRAPERDTNSAHAKQIEDHDHAAPGERRYFWHRRCPTFVAVGSKAGC